MPAKNKVKLGTQVSPELVDRMRRILYWSNKGRTQQSIVERGLMLALEEIEQAENRGSPFRPIPGEKKPSMGYAAKQEGD